ncbi:MAG: ArsA-related P-loop ATPase [Myxococcota bacterium]
MGDPRDDIRARLARPFQVVTGKGGVGRTLISCALALRAARSGERVLLVEVSANDNATRYLGVEPAVDTPKEVLPNLWLCRMTPAGALREYALLILRFRALYNLVFENRLVKYLLRSIPSLAEVTLMGKTWYHSTEQLKDGRPKYSRIVFDAPATGHALTMLSVSRVVADTVPPGVLKTAAEKMAALIESETGACLHVVALPEEMPVNEALELSRAAETTLHTPAGVAFLNRWHAPLFRPEDAAVFQRLKADPSPKVRPYVEAAEIRLLRQKIEEEHTARLIREVNMPILSIEEAPADIPDPALLERVVEQIEQGLGGAP